MASATTPDGVPLAGWWWRALALVIDTIILGIIGALIAFPWVRDVLDSYSDWFDDALNSDGSSVDTSQLQSDIAGPLAIITLIQLVLGFAYNVGFLMWKQATPGKLILGLRVRLRDRPGPMPIGTVLLRWVGQFGVGILGLLPVLGSLTFIYTRARLPLAAVGRQEAGDPRQDREDQRDPAALSLDPARASAEPVTSERPSVVRSAGPVRQSLYGWL